MKFQLDESQQATLSKWIDEQNAKAIEIQKQDPENHKSAAFQLMWSLGQPYTGAVGGAVTYSFTPTSIGTIINVEYDVGCYQAKIDLTDYDMF